MNDTMDLALFRQSIIDAEQLNLLAIGFQISAGFNALFSVFGLFYVFMGAVVSQVVEKIPPPQNATNQPPPEFVGWLFAAIGMVFMIVFVTLAILKFVAASCIKKRRSRVFCMVIAGIMCLEFPYGTAIGIMAFICLGRQSVERLFNVPIASRPV
jgi:hypothetical protein